MRTISTLLGAALVAVPLLFSWPMASAVAQEEQVCADRPRLTASLIGQWGELPAVVGRTQTQVMEVWLNPETGSWTLVITSEAGISCIGAAGSDGQAIKENPVLG
ncbi:MAG: hypothetical protein ACFCVH_17300 [Alphaproteobacteria bacterium]